MSKKIITLSESLSKEVLQVEDTRSKITDEVLVKQLKEIVELSFECDLDNPKEIDPDNIVFRLVSQNGEFFVLGELPDGRTVTMVPFYGEDFEGFFMALTSTRQEIYSLLADFDNLFAPFNDQVA